MAETFFGSLLLDLVWLILVRCGFTQFVPVSEMLGPWHRAGTWGMLRLRPSWIFHKHSVPSYLQSHGPLHSKKYPQICICREFPASAGEFCRAFASVAVEGFPNLRVG